MNWYKLTPLLATRVLLCRFSTPDPWVDLEELFGMFSSQLAEVFRESLYKFLNQKHKLIASPLHGPFIADSAERWATTTMEKLGCLDNCIMIIDGTFIGIARPGGADINQRVAYNGHERNHALKFQAISTPDGLCVHVHGPEVGCHHDMWLYHNSHMD